MQNKLLPCPFCGSEPKIDIVGIENPCMISCPNGCGGTRFNSREKSIQQWNTRINPELDSYKTVLTNSCSILEAILKDYEYRASDSGFQALFNLKNDITQALDKKE